MKINVYSEIYVVIQFFLFVNLCNFYNSIAVKSKIYEKFPNEMSCLSEKKGGKKLHFLLFPTWRSEFREPSFTIFVTVSIKFVKY